MGRAIVVHFVGRAGDDCRALTQELASSGYVVRSFVSASDFLARGLSERPECLMIEAVPECNGLELQERVGAQDSTVPMIFVARQCDFRVVVRAMRAGAIDFLQMPAPSTNLLDALARAVDRAAALRAAECEHSAAMERFDRLTPRERAIFAQVLEGRLDKQIAAALECQEATVKVHRSRLMRKLGVRSLARLVQFGHEIGAT